MKNIKPIYFAIGAIILLFLIFGSCSGRPDAGDVEDDLAERIETESEGRITLIDFEKTNSVEREAFGQESYTIYFTGKIRFEEDCYIYVNKSGMGPFFESFKTYKKQPEFIPSMGRLLYSVDKGEEVEFKDKVTYLETEEGWVKSVEPKLY